MRRLAIWLAAAFAGTMLAVECALAISDPFMQRCAVAISLLLTGAAVARLSEERAIRERQRLRQTEWPELKSADVHVQKLYELNKRMLESKSLDVFGIATDWSLVGIPILCAVYWVSRDSTLLAWAAAGYGGSSAVWLVPYLRKAR